MLVCSSVLTFFERMLREAANATAASDNCPLSPRPKTIVAMHSHDSTPKCCFAAHASQFHIYVLHTLSRMTCRRTISATGCVGQCAARSKEKNSQNICCTRLLEMLLVLCQTLPNHYFVFNRKYQVADPCGFVLFEVCEC